MTRPFPREPAQKLWSGVYGGKRGAGGRAREQEEGEQDTRRGRGRARGAAGNKGTQFVEV